MVGRCMTCTQVVRAPTKRRESKSANALSKTQNAGSQREAHANANLQSMRMHLQHTYMCHRCSFCR